MDNLFFYGTLRHAPLFELILGDAPAPFLGEAVLPGHEVLWAKGQGFPFLRRARGKSARGLLARGVNAEARVRLDFYELGFGYDVQEVTVLADGSFTAAEVYFPRPGLWQPGAPWALEDWVRDWWPLTRYAAAEAMSYFGELSGEEVARRFPMIQTRAASRVRAGLPAPAELRTDFGAEGVCSVAGRRPYANYFTLEEHDLSFRRFDGAMSEVVTRAGFVGGDAVTVLPYDPARDRVLVIEQFRFGPHLRGDPRPWVLEPIAGRIDAGESPEDCARREGREEAGLDLVALEPVAAYYPSPGAFTEFLYSFVAVADLPDAAAGVHGMDHEHEDIRTHVIGFERLMELVSTGEAGCGPLVLSALWLQQNRARLRGSG